MKWAHENALAGTFLPSGRGLAAPGQGFGHPWLNIFLNCTQAMH